MKLSRTLAAALATLLSALPAAAEAPDVVASIKPVHSLVAQVMEGVGEPELLVDGAASPHTYALKPSDAAAIEEADLLFWIGETLEPFMADAVGALANGAVSVELSEAEGLLKLPLREGGLFEAHGHGANAEHGGHSSDEHALDGGDAHGGADMHFWLDPENAKAMIGAIEAALSEADPANAERYAGNAEAAVARLAALQREIEALLAPERDKPFVVFHDAYHYFENRFGLAAAGSITVSPDLAPGARRVAEIRERVQELGAVCVFAEPQFEQQIVSTVIEGTEARSGVLDPEGAGIPNGPELYATLLRNLANAMKDCLSQLP